MHFSLLEKLGASVLVCAWLIYGANFLGNTLVPKPDGAAVAAAAPAAGERPAAATAAPAGAVDFAALLAAADPAAGEKVWGKCRSCHSIEAGGPHRVGPNLHGVVGRPVASAPGFAYSAALTGLGGEWTVERLGGYLEKPAGFAPGTKMTFAGLSKAEERAAIIVWLQQQGGSR